MSRRVQAIDPLTRAEFRPTGRPNAIHMVTRTPSSQWDHMDIREKMDAVEKAYITLIRKGDRRSDREQRKLNSLKRWFIIQKRKNRRLRTPVDAFFKKIHKLRERIEKRSSEMTGQDIREMAKRMAAKKMVLHTKGRPKVKKPVHKIVGVGEAQWGKMDFKKRMNQIDRFLSRPGDLSEIKKVEFWVRNNMTKAKGRNQTTSYLKKKESERRETEAKAGGSQKQAAAQEEILRKGLIRLAHEHPEFRDDILFLVTENHG